ncbi:hypothetical protein KBC04_02265 [Candidatus Babeliales bacterium]|nr:hypothetical protein [Candidatus Babeliales bacterium]MBP9843767.1 hypothetical protein [Candidatus Babeliales bacterium]
MKRVLFLVGGFLLTNLLQTGEVEKSRFHRFYTENRLNPYAAPALFATYFTNFKRSLSPIRTTLLTERSISPVLKNLNLEQPAPQKGSKSARRDECDTPELAKIKIPVDCWTPDLGDSPSESLTLRKIISSQSIQRSSSVETELNGHRVSRAGSTSSDYGQYVGMDSPRPATVQVQPCSGDCPFSFNADMRVGGSIQEELSRYNHSSSSLINQSRDCLTSPLKKARCSTLQDCPTPKCDEFQVPSSKVSLKQQFPTPKFDQLRCPTDPLTAAVNEFRCPTDPLK